jgi:hypothetical protein
MADHTVGRAVDIPVFISNSETSEVTCACWVKFKTELEKTLLELKSAQKIIELLQEEINLSTPNQTVSTDACYLHHNENSTQLELKKEKRKKKNWVHVLSSRREKRQ